MFHHVRTKFFTAFTLLGLAAGAHSANVVGSSGLLNASDANRIESWLNQGHVQFDNVFTKGNNSNSFDFHAAADGKGDTISILSVSFGNGQQALIGGYNPESWNSTADDWTYSMAGGAFLFNLTTDTVQRQNNPFQTYNVGAYGPTFGGGPDIYVAENLNSGFALSFSYGSMYAGKNILDATEFARFSVNGLEVFTVSTVPEPETYAMLLGGFGLISAIARRRKAKQA